MSQPNFENFKGKEACRLDKRKYKFYASREKKNTHIQLISSGQNKTQVKKKTEVSKHTTDSSGQKYL